MSAAFPVLQCVVQSGAVPNDKDSAVKAIKSGAKEYLPLPPDEELIAAVWGENATDQSYCGRLYVAINAIRKDGLITIIFDGENYKII